MSQTHAYKKPFVAPRVRALARRAAATTLLCGACGRSAPSTSPERMQRLPERLEVLIATEIDSIDPRISTDAVALRVSRLVHAGLFRLDPETLQPIPYVAKTFAWQDSHTLRVLLRDDVFFSSGARLEADDVVATIVAFQAESSRHRRVVDAIATAAVSGEREVTITLKRDHGTLLSDLELPIMNRAQAMLAPNSNASSWSASPTPDGLGPFQVERHEQGALYLKPREGGALPKPTHSLVFRTVRDENARALRMRGSAADVSVNGFSPALLPMGPKLEVESRSAASLTYLLPNWKASLPLAVRHALSLAFDRARFAVTLFAGHAAPAHSLLPPMHWAATHIARDDAEVSSESPQPYPFNPQRARATLTEAGYATDGSDPRLRFSLLVSTDRLRTSVARVAAQELRKVGLSLDVTPLELGSMMARLSAGDFDLAILQIPELSEPNALKTFLHSTSKPPFGSNRGRIQDAELDAALDRGEHNSDPALRKQAYADVEARARIVLPIIPLWNEHLITLKSERAAAFHPSAEGRWLSFATMP
jgi:peptide/nickel transport system substrate-binding protein